MIVLTLSDVLKDFLLIAASLTIWNNPISLTQLFGYTLALFGLFRFKTSEIKNETHFSQKTIARFGIYSALAMFVTFAWMASSMKFELSLESTGRDSHCSWVFNEYQPSKYELSWLALVEKDPKGENICKLLHSPEHSEATYHLANLTIGLASGVHGILSDTEMEKYFSRMVYHKVCNGKVLVIS
jgi:hypothetical protein